MYKFPAFLDTRSGASAPALSAENVDRIEHYHIRRLGLLQILMTSYLVKQLCRRERPNMRSVRRWYRNSVGLGEISAEETIKTLRIYAHVSRT